MRIGDDDDDDADAADADDDGGDDDNDDDTVRSMFVCYALLCKPGGAQWVESDTRFKSAQRNKCRFCNTAFVLQVSQHCIRAATPAVRRLPYSVSALVGLLDSLGPVEHAFEALLCRSRLFHGPLTIAEDDIAGPKVFCELTEHLSLCFT